ncbi:IGHMBP2 family helicase [Nitrosophilus labii]|uniref:IGHMBP2 family helicase n=1 Tax=Nitrosophilus labii TaxID=2706014 RepID=UPI0018D63A8E|nr:IGHMBP2 family helicase [Nitrosophilus labii]
MSILIILPKVTDDKEFIKQLKKLKLKKSDIKTTYHANGYTLIVLKKRVKIKPPKNIIPTREEEEEIKSIHQFVEENKYLIELERVAEISQQINEIKGFSGYEREIFGRAVLDLKGQKQPKRLNLYFVKFGRNRSIDTEISSGDIVLISRGEPLKSDITGTVSEVKKHFITVAFENNPPKWVYLPGIRIDLYINDITFKRMEENLEELRDASGRKRYLRNIALGLKEPSQSLKSDFEVFNQNLNGSQKEAVSFAIGSKELFLIHGPPGTGKTSTLIEIILQEVKRKNRVLAVADSNTAVDNMLQRLADKDISLVRIGHPARILSELEEFSIHAKYEKSFEAEAIKKGWEEVALLVKKREEFSKPTQARSRGMSYDRILTLAARGKSQRGISVQTMQSMAKWIKYDRKIESLVSSLRLEEEEAYKKIIKTCDVVLATNSMVMSEMLKSFEFDVAVIDEGSQQIIPSSLIPIMRSNRFIIAGDHKQLPPTVVSEEAKKLKISLFEKLIESHKNLSKMLKVQYRMNEKIMGFSNKMFYNGELVADESVKNHTLADFELKEPTKYEDILDVKEPLVFLDTKGIEAAESLPDRSTSYENVKEAEIVVDLVKELLNMGMKEEDIGVISPYLSQVKRIKQVLSEDEILTEVKSVDGFQGREKEVIIISFVRSNEEGKIGFLKDLRRLNVAITRAKRKLICIGDSTTLSKEEIYKQFLEYIKEEGKVVNVY